MFGSFLPSLRSSINHSLLGSRSRHCYAIKWVLVRTLPVSTTYQALAIPSSAKHRTDVPHAEARGLQYRHAESVQNHGCLLVGGRLRCLFLGTATFCRTNI